MLLDLQGRPCANPKCQQPRKDRKGYSSIYQVASSPARLACQNFRGDGILDRLRASQKPDHPDITRESAKCQCLACRRHTPVNPGSPLFRSMGGGSYSLTQQALAMWSCTEGVSVAHTVNWHLCCSRGVLLVGAQRIVDECAVLALSTWGGSPRCTTGMQSWP